MKKPRTESGELAEAIPKLSGPNEPKAQKYAK